MRADRCLRVTFLLLLIMNTQTIVWKFFGIGTNLKKLNGHETFCWQLKIRQHFQLNIFSILFLQYILVAEVKSVKHMARGLKPAHHRIRSTHDELVKC